MSIPLFIIIIQKFVIINVCFPDSLRCEMTNAANKFYPTKETGVPLITYNPTSKVVKLNCQLNIAK